MNNPVYAHALRADLMQMGPSPRATVGIWGRIRRRAWGMVCGAAFVTVRSSIYVIVLPLAACACLAGAALYAIQAVTGGNHG